MKLTFREIRDEDKMWIEALMKKEWGALRVVSRGRIHEILSLPGVVALADGEPKGIATYEIQGEDCELVTLNSTLEGKGIGIGLINSVINITENAGCKRLWLITTNDNTHALRFYQKRGFRLVKIYPNAIDESRKLKPEIPKIGNDGIPIRDEIEMETVLV